jgi:predicted GH43/DUF377 family glycosyl hydrolase
MQAVSNASLFRTPEGTVESLVRGLNGIDWLDWGNYKSVQMRARLAPDGRALTLLDQPPVMEPTLACEEPLGIEDAKVYWDEATQLYHILYAAVSWQQGTPFETKLDRIAYATANRDWTVITKYGLIGPDMKSRAAQIIRLPDGRYCILWTGMSDTPQSTIYAAYVDELSPDAIRRALAQSWRNRHDQTVLGPLPKARRGPEIGGTLWTPRGWVLFFPASDVTKPKPGVRPGEWHIWAARANLEDPCREVELLPWPVLVPEHPIETGGKSPYIAMATGAIDIDERVVVSYGAGDVTVALAEGSLNLLHDNFDRFGVYTIAA